MNPSNTGHGHVHPRPDGAKARCGGPAMCPTCAVEAAQLASEKAKETPRHSYAHEWQITVKADDKLGAIDALFNCIKAWQNDSEPLGGACPASMGNRQTYDVRKIDRSTPAAAPAQTPRTDAAWRRYIVENDVHGLMRECSQLETELSALRAPIVGHAPIDANSHVIEARENVAKNLLVDNFTVRGLLNLLQQQQTRIVADSATGTKIIKEVQDENADLRTNFQATGKILDDVGRILKLCDAARLPHNIRREAACVMQRFKGEQDYSRSLIAQLSAGESAFRQLQQENETLAQERDSLVRQLTVAGAHVDLLRGVIVANTDRRPSQLWQAEAFDAVLKQTDPAGPKEGV